MTTKEFMSSNTVKMVAYAILVGAAWATLQAQVTQKADKTDVVALAADAHAIRVLVCRQTPTDSFCVGVK